MGETADRYLQPFPAPDHTAMISTDATNFSLGQMSGSFILKCSALNGDALYSFPAASGPTEVRFGPSDGTTKFRWDFIPAN
jgi:hypothetical protein